MVLSDAKLYKIIVDNEAVKEEDLQKAQELAIQNKSSLYDALVREDFISDENLGFLLADYYSVPFINLFKVSIPPDVLRLIPEEVSRKQHLIAFGRDESGLKLAMSDPTNMTQIGLVERRAQTPVKVYFATNNDISNAQGNYREGIQSEFADIVSEQVKEARGVREELSVVKIIDTIFTYAYQSKASDIHIEPENEQTLVRFRIDGILHDILKLPLSIYSYMVIRIKVMANLRTDEHLAPQDGKIQFKTEKELLDIRVSIVPILRGEKIVMRLLSEHTRQISLQQLGFSEEDFHKIREAYKRSYGMILATGPTGSGKTTTMYAIIKLLNNRDVNIMTIEDPIEYDIEGVNQIQVNQKTNLTFATGLRSILRQDPNIILVGEIRDEETADIAINSAMTGHLVLSTLHTNDAATAIPRLFDMNVEPFLVASTINVIVAQRLVRKIHSVCRVSEEIEVSSIAKNFDSKIVKDIFGDQKKVRLYRGKGCEVCHKTGYEGRVGAYEVLVIDDEIRQAISDKKDASVIRGIAVKNGMNTLVKDGLSKVNQGVTTIEEVLRVAKE